MRSDGVRTIEDIKARCWVDEVTGCWHWRYGCTGKGAPSVRISALRATVSIGVAICFLTTGERPKQGKNWHVTCTTPHCANPDHRKEGSRKSQMAQRRGKPLSPEHRARITLARRKGSIVTEEAAAEIRAWEGSLSEIAERHGISVTYACAIRIGKSRKPQPLPQASVFAIGRTL